MKAVEAYPLSWPSGTPRTKYTRRSAFKCDSIFRASEKLMGELKMLRASDIIISTNLKVRNDGMLYSKQAQPVDKGVAIYFRWRDAPRSMACDKWDKIEDNIHALALSIEAMRGLERWGATDILQKVFQGFTALPAPGKQWWEVLECSRDASIDTIEARYKAMAKYAHPDVGGSNREMAALNNALEEARRDK